jgi:hypothetical protein
MKFDRTKFWAEYKNQFGHPPHGPEKNATEQLLGFIENDPQLARLEWAAYLLGTIRNEVGSNMLPIKEIKAKPGTPVWENWQKKYWGTGFFGRGYAQLTWEGNYRKFGKLLGLDLVKNPDLVLLPEVGYKVLAIGCVQGLFRGRTKAQGGGRYKLSDFLARQIVNGISGAAFQHALREADYSTKYEACLRAASLT